MSSESEKPMKQTEPWAYDVFIDDHGKPQCDCETCRFHRKLAKGNEWIDCPYPEELTDEQASVKSVYTRPDGSTGTKVAHHYTRGEKESQYALTYRSHCAIIAHRMHGSRAKVRAN